MTRLRWSCRSLFECLAGRHALGVQEQDLIVHRVKAALMLLHQLRFEAAGSVTWCGQLKLAVLSLQRLVRNAVTVVVRLGLFMLVEAEMIIHCRVQRCLNGYLGQHLPELVEIVFLINLIGAQKRT